MVDCVKARNDKFKVRRLQRALYLKSKQEEGVRFYSVYDKIYRDDVLWEAWRQVKANKGAPGIDRIAIDMIVTQGKEVEMIERIKVLLCEQHYQFKPVRRVEIPKPKGGTRPLGIATVEDRIVQTAMKIVIEPIYEADFQECSYGYRPKRNAKQASEAIRNDLYNRAGSVVEIDFRSYFDSIPHAKLMKLIQKRISDGAMLKLIKQTLKVGVEFKGIVTPTKVGVPQGSPISPLYSNIYLNLIDQLWHKRGYPEKIGATIHRYADDLILVCRKSAAAALGAFKAIADRMDLVINQDKTHITKLTDGFNFIGFNFVKRRSPTSGKNNIYIFPAKNAEQKVRNRIKHLTSRRAPISPGEFIDIIKPVVMGWVNYFRHTNANNSFRKLQRFVNVRFRRYLNCRSKGRGFGWDKYPNRKLYAMGMFYFGSGMLERSSKPVHGVR